MPAQTSTYDLISRYQRGDQSAFARSTSEIAEILGKSRESGAVLLHRPLAFERVARSEKDVRLVVTAASLDLLVVTAASLDLQQFLLRSLALPNAWDKPTVLVKVN